MPILACVECGTGFNLPALECCPLCQSALVTIDPPPVPNARPEPLQRATGRVTGLLADPDDGRV